MRTDTRRVAPHYAAALSARHRRDVRQANVAAVGTLVGAACLLIGTHVLMQVLQVDAPTVTGVLSAIVAPLLAPAKALLGLGGTGVLTQIVAGVATMFGLWLAYRLLAHIIMRTERRAARQ